MNATTGSILSLLVGVCLATAGIAGCGDDDQASTLPMPTTNGPLVSLTKSGGIAGIEERLVVKQDGRAIVSDRDGVVSRFKIPSAEFRSLAENLAAHPVGDFDPAPETGCADCFEYAVTYRGQSYSVDEVSLNGEAKEVVEPLLTILTAHIPLPNSAGTGGK